MPDGSKDYCRKGLTMNYAWMQWLTGLIIAALLGLSPTPGWGVVTTHFNSGGVWIPFPFPGDIVPIEGISCNVESATVANCDFSDDLNAAGFWRWRTTIWNRSDEAITLGLSFFVARGSFSRPCNIGPLTLDPMSPNRPLGGKVIVNYIFDESPPPGAVVRDDRDWIWDAETDPLRPGQLLRLTTSIVEPSGAASSCRTTCTLANGCSAAAASQIRRIKLRLRNCLSPSKC
jgi:hypothetical protein